MCSRTLINTIKKNGAPVDGYGMQGHDLMATGSGPTNCIHFNTLKNFNFQEDTTARNSTIADSTIAIGGGLHLQAKTLQAYDVFDLNGVRLGRLRAYTIVEAVSILKNTSDIKVQGVYMLRSVRNGTVKQVRIAR